MTGSGSRLSHIANYMAKGLQAEVVLSDPLQRIQVASSVEAAVTDDRMGAAPAIGLAMGGAT